MFVIPLFERTPLNLDDRLSVKNDHVGAGSDDASQEFERTADTS